MYVYDYTYYIGLLSLLLAQGPGLTKGDWVDVLNLHLQGDNAEVPPSKPRFSHSKSVVIGREI